MQDGFIKTAFVTPELKVADCAHNASVILSGFERACVDGAKLVAFPELCVTGYTCGDLFLQRVLQDGAQKALETILEGTKQADALAVVGLPVAVGGNLYNCAAMLYRGEILGVVPKQNLPNYSEFYEKRYFSPAPAGRAKKITLLGRECPFGAKLLFRCETMPEFCVGVEICEDLWAPAQPSVGLARAGASVIVNLSASDEMVGKDSYRRQLVRGQSARLSCAYVYCNAGEGESTTDLVFFGQSLIAENGVVLTERTSAQGGYGISEIDVQRLRHERQRLQGFSLPPEEENAYTTVGFQMELERTALTRTIATYPFIPEQERERDKRCEHILQMQAAGLKTRMAHMSAKKAVVGVSGGLDSGLALLVTARACDLLGLARENVIAVTMPGFGTTDRTHTNAIRLCRQLGVQCREISIAKAVEQHFKDIGHDGSADTVFENAQARERTQLLMDIANQTGGLVVGTGDLSELALGWATYNGDHMSMYGVNASVPKTLVRHLVRYEANRSDDHALRDVLSDILDTPVSPELLPTKQKITQKTEDILGPYALHDFFLYYTVRFGFAPRKVFRMACYAFKETYEAPLILRCLETFYKRFIAQQYKRSCMPDGPKVGSVTLSPRGDWRMPSDASASLWIAQIETLKEEQKKMAEKTLQL